MGEKQEEIGIIKRLERIRTECQNILRHPGSNGFNLSLYPKLSEDIDWILKEHYNKQARLDYLAQKTVEKLRPEIDQLFIDMKKFGDEEKEVNGILQLMAKNWVTLQRSRNGSGNQSNAALEQYIQKEVNRLLEIMTDELNMDVVIKRALMLIEGTIRQIEKLE